MSQRAVGQLSSVIATVVCQLSVMFSKLAHYLPKFCRRPVISMIAYLTTASYSMITQLTDFLWTNNNNNNKQICIAPQGRNFRGAGARHRVSEQRKKRKPERRGMSLA